MAQVRMVLVVDSSVAVPALTLLDSVGDRRTGEGIGCMAIEHAGLVVLGGRRRAILHTLRFLLIPIACRYFLAQ